MDLNINVDIAVNFGLTEAAKEWIMAALSDAIASATASADAALARVSTDLDSLRGKVAALQAQVDSGGASPADMQALADLKTKLDALDPSNPAVMPA